MPPIDLRPDHMEMVREVLRSYVPGREVRAYGSRAQWSAHDSSDLDLVVMSESLLDNVVLGSLRGAFEESDLPFRVDVFDWSALPKSFHAEIEREYSVVMTKLDAPDWSEHSVRELAPLSYGKALPSRLRNAHGEFPVYGSNGVIGYHDQALTESPAIIVGRKGTAGAVHFSPMPCWPIDTTFYHEEPDRELALFKYYALSTLGLTRMNFDSAVPGLNRDAAHSVRLLVPPSRERESVAGVLGALDRKIELNRRMCETLDEMAQTLYKEWFVDFAPVKAKMEGRWREGESLPGLPAEMYHHFPSQLIDTELGPIPDDWNVTCLGDITQKPQYGYTQSANARSVGPKFLRITDINKRPWVEWHEVPHCEIDAQDLGNYRLSYGDFLVARIADPGHSYMYEGEIEAVFASYLIRFRLLNQDYDRFVQYWLRSSSFWQLVSSRKSGSTRSNLNATVLSEFPLVLPDTALARSFGQFVQGCRKRMSTLVENSLVMRTSRDALLPRLISGELRVSAPAAGQS